MALLSVAALISEDKMHKSVLLHSLLTCLYLPLFVFLLKHYGILYEIGKHSFLPFLNILPAAECLKLLLTYNYYGEEQKGNRSKKNFLSHKLSECFKCIFLLCLMIVVYYIIAILFGAPLLSEQEETFMFSALLVCLTVLPVCLHMGWESGTSLLINLNAPCEDIVSRIMQQNVILTLFGAWLGAVVIPLDWDRPWQVWPIPCSLGALAGYFFSNLFTLNQFVLKTVGVFHQKSSNYKV